MTLPAHAQQARGRAQSCLCRCRLVQQQQIARRSAVRANTYTQPSSTRARARISLQVHLVVGGWLLLRAARPIAEGAELTTCHIGAGRFQHVASRRAQLQREVRGCVTQLHREVPGPTAARGAHSCYQAQACMCHIDVGMER